MQLQQRDLPQRKSEMRIFLARGCDLNHHPEPGKLEILHTHVSGQVMAVALVRIGDYVASDGWTVTGYIALRATSCYERVRVERQALRREGETIVEAATPLPSPHR